MTNCITKRNAIGATILLLTGAVIAILVWQLTGSDETVDAQAIIENICEKLIEVTSGRDFDYTMLVKADSGDIKIDVRRDKKDNIYMQMYDDQGDVEFEGISINISDANTKAKQTEEEAAGSATNQSLVVRYQPVSYTHLTLPTKRIV